MILNQFNQIPMETVTLQPSNWSFFLLIQSLTGKWNVAESLVLCSDLDFPTVLGQHPHTGLATSNYFGCPIPGWRLCPPWETETSPIFQREPLSKRACIVFKKSWGTNTVRIFRARQHVLVVGSTVLNQIDPSLSLGSATCYINNLEQAILEASGSLYVK